MNHRLWLLGLPALTLVYFIVLTVSPLLSAFNWLVMSDDRSTMILWLGLGGLASWPDLELAAGLRSRGASCGSCGYALSGLKCPECGDRVGASR